MTDAFDFSFDPFGDDNAQNNKVPSEPAVGNDTSREAESRRDSAPKDATPAPNVPGQRVVEFGADSPGLLSFFLDPLNDGTGDEKATDTSDSAGADAGNSADDAAPTAQDSASNSELDSSVRGDRVDSSADRSVAFDLSDEDVARIFGEIAEEVGSAIRNDKQTLLAAASVIEAEAHLLEVEKQHVEAEKKVKEVDTEILELERRLTELKRAKSDLKNNLWTVSQDKRRADRDVREKKTAAQTQAEAIKDREEAEKSYVDLLDKAKQYRWYTGVGPDGKKALPHQMLAMSFITTGKRCILGDKMGLGKTLSAIGSLDLLDSKKTLIITPADITTNFQREIQFWTDHRPAINLRGQTRAMKQQMLQAIQLLPVFTVIVNYESWRRDPRFLTSLVDVGFDTIIMDEAHNMKNASTDAFQGVRQIVHTVNKCPRDGSIMRLPAGADTKVEGGRVCTVCGWKGESVFETSYEGTGLANYADRFWLTRSIQNVIPMTGTAILNKPQDIFPLLHLIDPITFDKEATFNRMYAEWDYNKGQYGFSAGGINSLMAKLRGKFLARSMKDAGIILPPQHPIVHQVTFDNYPKQLAVVRQIAQFATIALSETKKHSITAIIAQITRQRQANVWPGGIEIWEPLLGEFGQVIKPKGRLLWRVSDEVQESVKLDKARSLIDEFTSQGERVVVFSQFSTALQELHKRVNNMTNDNGDLVSSVVFDGSTPNSVREEIKTNFDRKMAEPKKWDVVMANYKTGGVGLNLTAATHVIVLDREWNPGKEDQALARVFRIGQTEETFVHIIEIEGTIDEWLNDLIQMKAQMINGFDEGVDDLKEELMKKMKKFLDDTK